MLSFAQSTYSGNIIYLPRNINTSLNHHQRFSSIRQHRKIFTRTLPTRIHFLGNSSSFREFGNTRVSCHCVFQVHILLFVGMCCSCLLCFRCSRYHVADFGVVARAIGNMRNRFIGMYMS